MLPGYPIHLRILPEDMAAMYETATGIPMTTEELTEASRRIVLLERFFNMREGVRREADTLPGGLCTNRWSGLTTRGPA